MTVVLDASAALAWVMPGEFDGTAAHQADLVQAQGGITPPLWHLEVSNAFLVAERRGRFTPANSAEAWGLLDNFPLEESELDPPDGELLALARKHGLTAYDASYLWLAMRMGLPLLTRDERLIAAARATGVELG